MRQWKGRLPGGTPGVTDLILRTNTKPWRGMPPMSIAMTHYEWRRGSNSQLVVFSEIEELARRFYSSDVGVDEILLASRLRIVKQEKK